MINIMVFNYNQKIPLKKECVNSKNVVKIKRINENKKEKVK